MELYTTSNAQPQIQIWKMVSNQNLRKNLFNLSAQIVCHVSYPNELSLEKLEPAIQLDLGKEKLDRSLARQAVIQEQSDTHYLSKPYRYRSQSPSTAAREAITIDFG